VPLKAAAWSLLEQELVMRRLYLTFTFFLQIFFNETVDTGPYIDPWGRTMADEGPVIDPWGRG
jgi:hypothetical protein